MARTTKKTSKSSKPTRRARAAQQDPRSKPRPKTKANRVVREIQTEAPTVSQRKWWQRTPSSERPTRPKLPNVWRLTRSAYELLTINLQLILGIAVVYGVLNVLTVRGLSGGVDVSGLKSQFSGGGWGNVASSFNFFTTLISSSNSGNTSATASAYQSFIVLVTSLALVWTFRQLLAEKPRQLRVRDGFYKGMYPLVPVLLILLVIAIQLIPMTIGGLLYSLITANGIAASTGESVIWFILFIATAIWSLLLIVPSVIALYIVTLPDMTPIKALHSAKELVRFRRPVVLRKLLFLPMLIFVVLAAVLLPVILVVPVLAQWIFLWLSILILPSVHAYIYTLYRELLHE